MLELNLSTGQVINGEMIYNRILIDDEYRAATPPFVSPEYRLLCEMLMRLENATQEKTSVFLMLPPSVPIVAGEPCVPVQPSLHLMGWNS